MLKQIVKVYWRYFWGRLRGRNVILFGHWSSSRFKCMELQKPPGASYDARDYLEETKHAK